MPEPLVTVVIPTLAAGPKLDECLRSLERQTLPGVEVVVVDNSGQGLVARSEAGRGGARVIENRRNAGFGGAVNQGFERGRGRFLATLNDDAEAEPQWLEALVAAMESAGDVGMCASRVMLAHSGRLDSAGMLLAADGTSKQRGQGREPADFGASAEVLFPSGSAALYRREMLEEIGYFDDSFFLYCEDTDLGLRARWSGWRCLYVPDAVVEHHYSHSAGRASPLKAYLVERNRVFVVFKDFPVSMIAWVPLAATARYFWHVVSILEGRGAAADFQRDGNSPLRLLWYVVRAHLAAAWAWRHLWRERRAIRRRARLTAREFRRLVAAHSIGAREVASL